MHHMHHEQHMQQMSHVLLAPHVPHVNHSVRTSWISVRKLSTCGNAGRVQGSSQFHHTRNESLRRRSSSLYRQWGQVRSGAVPPLTTAPREPVRPPPTPPVPPAPTCLPTCPPATPTGGGRRSSTR